jgi:hypothetical protein
MDALAGALLLISTSHFADTTVVSQVLSDIAYFSRRVADEVARVKRSNSAFSIALFTSQPEPAELPEIACVRGLPAILDGVRETDAVCRIDNDSIAVLLIDTNGEGSRKAALRLLERMGDEIGRWRVSVLEYPERESILFDLGLVA